MSSSTITSKGQVTIPKQIRDELDLREGDRVFFVRRGNEITLKVLRGNILQLRGSVRASKQPKSFEKIRQETKEKIASRVARDG
jgi:antitoxin PrlF